MGRPLEAALFEYAAADGLPDPARAAAAMVETYRAFQFEHHDRLVTGYDGLRDVVAVLRGRGYVLGVVTSKGAKGARREIEQFGFADLLSVMVFLEDTARHKPEPEPLLEAARRGGFEPARAVYIGDSIHDIAAGRAAGMKTAGALWGPFNRRDLEAAGPDVLVETPQDLLTLLPGPARGRQTPGRSRTVSDPKAPAG
jgi:pyrophosphatase PpaX